MYAASKSALELTCTLMCISAISANRRSCDYMHVQFGKFGIMYAITFIIKALDNID